MAVLSQGTMPTTQDGRGPTNYDSLILQSLEVMGYVRSGDTVIGPEGISGLTGTFENVNITNGIFSGIVVDDIIMTNAVITGQITITAGSGILNLSDSGALAAKDTVDLSTGEVENKTAANIAETATLKWAGESGADVTAGKSLSVLIDKVTGNLTESGTNYFAGVSGADILSSRTQTITASGFIHTIVGTAVITGGCDLHSGGTVKIYSDAGSTLKITLGPSGIYAPTGQDLLLAAGGDLEVMSVYGDIDLTPSGNVTITNSKPLVATGDVSVGGALGVTGTSTLGVVVGTSFKGDHYSSDATQGIGNTYVGSPVAFSSITFKDGLLTAATTM